MSVPVPKTEGEAPPPPAAAAVRLLASGLVPSGHRSVVGLPLELREQGCAQGQDQQHSITQTATSFRHHHQRGPFGVLCVSVCMRVGGIFMSRAFTHTRPCGCESTDILSDGLWDGAIQFISSSFLAPNQTPVSAPLSLRFRLTQEADIERGTTSKSHSSKCGTPRYLLELIINDYFVRKPNGRNKLEWEEREKKPQAEFFR